MIIDGTAMAALVYGKLASDIEELSHAPHLTIFTCAPNFETQKYLNLKKRIAHKLGIAVNVIEFPEDCTTADMVQTVQHAQMQTDGIIVQLPLPSHIDTNAVIEAIPRSYDVDGMHYDGSHGTILSPVVGAIDAMCSYHDVLLATQQVVIVGHGRLVGGPAAVWAKQKGAHVTVITKETDPTEARSIIAHADILILGTGKPGLVTLDMVKEGVIIFDAGTSEEGGQLKGDADPNCATKASLMTPVPGGIGPMTVAMLLKNLVSLVHEA